MKNLSDHLPVEDITGKRMHISALTGIRTCEPHSSSCASLWDHCGKLASKNNNSILL